jgi:bifunctional non-homologous end joining protein LigD
VGTGFTDAMLHHLHEQLTVRHRGSAPVPDVPRDHARKARWVEPDLVGEVAYRTWTADGRLRHASWRGLRPDQPVTAARRAAPSPPVVAGALSTADGRWKVEVVRRDGYQSYRIRHADSVLEELTLADVECLLRAAGVQLADLQEFAEDRPAAASA